MARPTSYRLKLKQKGRYTTVARATTEKGLRSAYTRLREKQPKATIRISTPDSRNFHLKPGDTL